MATAKATRKEEDEDGTSTKKVAYFLRCSPVPEWVDAEVISELDGKELEPPMEDGSVHLRIHLDRKRHNSSRTVGYRFDVERGDQPGQWLPSRPEDADEVYKEALERYRIREEINIERARTKPEER